MSFDSRDLTVKLMASSQGGGCGQCTNTQQRPPGCDRCTHTQDQDENGDCQCGGCSATQTEVCSGSPDEPHKKKAQGWRSQAGLVALRQQLREALFQVG